MRRLAAALLLGLMSTVPAIAEISAPGSGHPAPGAAPPDPAGGVSAGGAPAAAPADGKGIGQKGATNGENMRKGDTRKLPP